MANYFPAERNVIFNEPTHSVTVTGGTITNLTVNSVTFTVVKTAEVIITGGVYEDLRESIVKEMPNVPANNPSENISIEEATLISRENAPEVADRMLAYYRNRYRLENRVMLEDEITGGITEVETMGENNLLGFIESMDIDLTGGFIGGLVINGQPRGDKR